MPIYKANCKINVHLRIVGKLPNGYHELETIFQEIPIYDEIEIVLNPTGKINFDSSGIEIPDGGTNICVKSAEILKERYKIVHGCNIYLKKNIPIGAGLGGGSSDAATVLKALNYLWELKLSDSELEKIGLELGADVPFFIKGGCAIATGIGEKLTQIDTVLKGGYILLIYPNIHINTSEAYRNLNLNLTKNTSNGIFALALNSSREIHLKYNEFINDFESYVFKEHGEIERLKNALLNEGAEYASMSGSGSSVFGFFTDKIRMKKVKNLIDQNYYVKAVKV
ncbi:MAG: 4-(cytidine 5'-diphospho)-2-C-methyl-D-erythritol kinase [Candidatus Delongbacteria bacterium]|jgi:4-diphosphocytidyl-2-C-methyl-D-erythritol kinase|nr:4-(cytidine 5'-diphospho)-2-C-methyl-D-erythritol kinase [Candidatus Delongbacteria bacterium]